MGSGGTAHYRCGKAGSVLLLIVGQIAVLSLWFVSAAVLPEMLAERPLSPLRQAALSSAVQAGFVLGALASAFLGLADRFDPRRLFAACALLAALANVALLVVTIGGAAAIALRFATGVLLAGVYPVGMKMAVGWGQSDRGLLVGLLVGGVTLGSAAPHLVAALGGSDWRFTVQVTSLAALLGGLSILFVGLGPFHAQSPRLRLGASLLAWRDRRIRLAIAGYLGHMWELYAMWAWIGVAAAASYSATLSSDAAEQLAKWTAFIAIASGGLASGLAGALADRLGKRRIAMVCLAGSGTAALATALSFGGAVWLTFALVVVWGITIIPDSAQFSALVADYAPADQAGSLMTLQTALGFALTIVTVQATPALADLFGWPPILAVLALGPLYGLWAMRRLKSA
ncbi:MAG: MFS transporter [Rhodospirillales bacterium]